jgi:hypothetical protein
MGVERVAAGATDTDRCGFRPRRCPRARRERHPVPWAGPVEKTVEDAAAGDPELQVPPRPRAFR